MVLSNLQMVQRPKKNEPINDCNVQHIKNEILKNDLTVYIPLTLASSTVTKI